MHEQELECPSCGANQGHIQLVADDVYWCRACGSHFDDFDAEPERRVVRKLRRDDGE